MTTRGQIAGGVDSINLAGSGGSNLVGFLQAGTGAVARTVQGKERDIVSVKDFGATGDGVTDDTAAIQAAIDSVGDTSATNRAGVSILIPCPCLISSTLVIRRKGIRLVGNGWGNRDDTGTSKSYLLWGGAAGTAMVQFSDCWAGAGISRLKLMGSTSAKPSCAVELNETNDSLPNQQLKFDQVYIGGFSSETGDGVQFTNGFQWTGTKINNSEHQINGCYISKCSGSGILQNSIQAVNLKVDHITIYSCGVGMYVTGQIQGSNWTFLNNTIDIQSPYDDGTSSVNSFITCHNYYSEGSARMLESDGVAKIAIYGGQFQISSSLNADGKIIKHEANTAWGIRLQDFTFTQNTSPPTSPYLSLRTAAAGAADKNVILDRITGWAYLTGGTNGLDIATRGPTDRAYIYFREHVQSASSTPARLAQNFLQGDGTDWDINRFHVRNDTGLKLHDDFTGDSLDTRWNSTVGSDGACAIAVKASEHGGAVRLTTGAGAGATMAVNGVQLDSYLNWTTQYGGLAIEARIRNSNTTSVCIFFGFTDQVAALEMPFTLAAGDVLTSNATDAVGFLYDSAADTDNYWLVGVKADVDATKQNSTKTLGGSTVWQTLRIELSNTGDATFFFNGAQVGTVLSNAVTSTVALTPILTTFRRGAASSTTDADYIHVESNRSF